MAIQYVDENCDVVGTVSGTYNIDNTNNKVQLTVDGGSVQNFTLTNGAARTPAQVAADLNATLVDATAYAPTYGPQSGKVRIRTSSSLGASSTILVGAPANHANALLGFTATTYTGHSRAHGSWTQVTGTKQELINQIETQLNAVGWTTVSGSGTTNLLLQSALTPPGQDLQMRLRCKDNGNNCVVLNIENVAGTVAQTNSSTAGIQLLPAAAKVWLFTVNKYQGFIRVPTVTPARGYAGFGVPMIPTFLQSVIVEAIWGGGNTENDTSTTVCGSFRTSLTHGAISSSNYAGICNGNIVQRNNSTAGTSGGVLVGSTMSVQQSSALVGYQWHDTSALLSDALVGWHLTTVTSVAAWRGHLWDAALVSESFTGDLTTTFDSHNWIVLTDANVGSPNNHQRGTLFLTKP